MHFPKAKHFNTLLSSLFISKLGDYAYEVVFIFIVLETTRNNYLLTGLVYFFRFIPFLFFGPVGGWLADNGRLKNNLLLSEWVRLLVTVLLFCTYLSGMINIIILIIASVLTTIGRSIFQPSFQTLILKMMDKKDLTSANSIVQVAEETASVTGPLVCSLLLLFVDKSWVLMFNSLTYFISALLILKLNDLRQEKQFPFKIKKVYQDTYSSIQHMYYSKYELFISISGSAICILFTGSVLRFIIPAVAISFGKSEIFTSYLFALIASGTIIGGLIYTYIIRQPSPSKLMRFWFVYGLIMLSMSFITLYSLYFLLPLSFALGICGAFVDITLVTTIQSYSEQKNIGKNFGAFSTLANTAEAVSGLMAGLIAAIGLMISFSIMTSMIALTGLTTMLLLSKRQK
ncbi:MFS transporter [Bartonella sp. DGB1]|uniref:MFS transporter n=1 Tax=Bartonella sp. DGB1 TaxID=3239807 RepID=UPI0035254D59